MITYVIFWIVLTFLLAIYYAVVITSDIAAQKRAAVKNDTAEQIVADGDAAPDEEEEPQEIFEGKPVEDSEGDTVAPVYIPEVNIGGEDGVTVPGASQQDPEQQRVQAIVDKLNSSGKKVSDLKFMRAYTVDEANSSMDYDEID